jgi:thiol-disulfide isomerase/thioredoxin
MANIVSTNIEQGSAAMNNDGYRFKTVTMDILINDMRFNKGTPAAGDSLPEFNLTSTSGERITWQNFGGRPVLLTVGSTSCPLTAASIPALKRLREEFGSEIEFVMVNVREAHPAENLGQPETFEEKLEHARALKEQYEIPWTVVTDDLDGSFHRSLDTKPNSAYIVGRDGVIAFRSLFASDERSLHEALTAVVTGKDPSKTESQAMFAPMARSFGYIQEVLGRAGPQAKRDMWRAAPPVVIAGLVASLFSSLAPEKRGAPAMALLAAMLVGGLSGIFFLLT